MCSVSNSGVAFELQLGRNVVVKDPILTPHGFSWPHVFFQALNRLGHLLINGIDSRLIFYNRMQGSLILQFKHSCPFLVLGHTMFISHQRMVQKLNTKVQKYTNVETNASPETEILLPRRHNDVVLYCNK